MKLLCFIMFWALSTSLYGVETSAAKGPFKVGTKTVKLKGLTTQIFYPGQPTNAKNYRFDLREYLPSREQSKIPVDADPFMDCDCVEGLALADQSQPWPIAIYIHGAAGFRTASANLAAAIASQGFVVIGADHPWIQLKDILKYPRLGMLISNQKRDVQKILTAIRENDSRLTFLGDLAKDNIALIGHSAGSGAVAALSGEKGVTAVVSMAGNGSIQRPIPKLIMGGMDDGLIRFGAQENTYEASSKPKVLAGLERAGHLAFTDICALMPRYGGILEAAIKFGVDVPDLVNSLGKDGCEEGDLDTRKGWEVINYGVTQFLLDAMITGKKDGSNLRNWNDQFPEIEVFKIDY